MSDRGSGSSLRPRLDRETVRAHLVDVNDGIVATAGVVEGLLAAGASLATIVSSPEPVLTFSMPQSVSLPVWLPETLPLATAPEPRLTDTAAVAAEMSSVSLPAPPSLSSPK